MNTKAHRKRQKTKQNNSLVWRADGERDIWLPQNDGFCFLKKQHKTFIVAMLEWRVWLCADSFVQWRAWGGGYARRWMSPGYSQAVSVAHQLIWRTGQSAVHLCDHFYVSKLNYASINHPMCWIISQDAHELFHVLTSSLEEEQERLPKVPHFFDMRSLEVSCGTL